MGEGDLATGLCSKLSARCCLAFCRHLTVALKNSSIVSDAKAAQELNASCAAMTHGSIHVGMELQQQLI